MAVIEIRQADTRAKPVFEVRVRYVELVPGDEPDTLVMESRGRPIGRGSVPPPHQWPVPADSRANLALGLAWYLEDFVRQVSDPSRQRSQYVLQALHDWGRDVFRKLFPTDKARATYAEIAESGLHDRHRMEIVSGDPGVLAWPWEALVDEDGQPAGLMLPIERRYLSGVTRPIRRPKPASAEHPQVLLVSARAAENDVPYRVIGRQLAASDLLRVTLLRPPTLDRLRAAMAGGTAWDVVHLDCHGWWGSLAGRPEQGYLLFEDGTGGLRPVSAEELVDALGEHCPAQVVLNACRSSMARGDNLRPFASVATGLLQHPDVVDVTAMAYNLQVDAAPPFLGSFYGGILGGERASIAAQYGRLMMQARPERACVGGTVTLHDWMIPTTYRRAGGERPIDDGSVIAPLWRGAGGRQPTSSTVDPFIGRDELILALDRAVVEGPPMIQLIGLTGQGKTALLHEFLWWRARTGDARSSIWIDLEQCADAGEVLRQMADRLPDPPAGQPALEELAAHVLRSLGRHERWVVWDHMYPLPATFTDGDRRVLASVVQGLDGKSSTILGAGREPAFWLGRGAPGIALIVEGLSDAERWRFAATVLDPQTLPTGRDGTRDGGLAGLLFYVAGNPMMMVDVLDRVGSGEEPDEVRRVLENDIGTVRPWRGRPADAQRLDEALRHLDDEPVRPVTPLLSLHDELVEPDALREMARRVHGPAGDHLVDTALTRIAAAGLLHLRFVLHPAVGGAVRAPGAARPSAAQRRAFVSTIHTRLNRGEPTRASVGTIERALQLAIEEDMLPEARKVGGRAVTFLTQRRDYARAQRVQDQIVATFAGDYRQPDAVSAALEAARIARERRDLATAERWLDEVRSADPPFAPNRRAHVLFEVGKLADLRGDFAGYRSAILAAAELIERGREPRLAELLDYELVQIHVRGGEVPQPEDRPDKPDSPLRAGGGYRAQAQRKLHAGELSEARALAQRAIAVARQHEDEIARAMNTSLLGDVESAAGRSAAAVERFGEAAAIFEAKGDRSGAGVVYYQLGNHYLAEGQVEEGCECLIHSATSFQEAGDRRNLAEVVRRFEDLLSQMAGKYDDFAALITLKWFGAALPALAGHSQGSAIERVFSQSESKGVRTMTSDADAVDIEGLADAEAERLLREVLLATGLNTRDLPQLPPDQSAEVLIEGLPESAGSDEEEHPDSVTKQALRVLAEDPAYRSLVTSEEQRRRARPEAGGDFGLDPLSFVAASTLALVVLNTYVDVQRRENGKWTFHFRIRPASRALQMEIIKLIRSLLPGRANRPDPDSGP